mgnify:CR=1 FL=1
MDMAIANAAMAYAKTLSGAAGSAGTDAAQPTTGPSFAQLVETATGSSIDTEKAGETAAMNALTKGTEMTDVAAAVNNAEVTLETIVAVRDQVISAYQNIMQMPV